MLNDPSRGRVTTWPVALVVASPTQADYPGLRRLVLVNKTIVIKHTGIESLEKRASVSSLAPEEKSPAQLLRLIRGH